MFMYQAGAFPKRLHFCKNKHSRKKKPRAATEIEGYIEHRRLHAAHAQTFPRNDESVVDDEANNIPRHSSTDRTQGNPEIEDVAIP
jgi:hypothetical protein